MTTESFRKWVEAKVTDEWYWFVKRLAANDTLATNAHQAGPYIPRSIAFDLFPSINDPRRMNPRISFSAAIDSHGCSDTAVDMVWYNQRTRNECRITRWGGSRSPLLDSDATGSIAIFIFRKPEQGDAECCNVWLCNLAEEEEFEDDMGCVEPGQPLFFRGTQRIPYMSAVGQRASCWLTQETMPPEWNGRFPTGSDIVDQCIKMRQLKELSVDKRLMLRRDCEFQIFRSIEQLLVLPRISEGFSSVEEFISYSNAVNNRRKSRSGRSLELQLSRIFMEEGIRFSHGEVSEGNKRPDFIFPSAERYRSEGEPVWMLAAKTTCKDRWRQILNEAARIPVKHLATLQEGISRNQFAEMKEAGVKLVVPQELQIRYPAAIRSELISLQQFVSSVRNL